MANFSITDSELREGGFQCQDLLFSLRLCQYSEDLLRQILLNPYYEYGTPWYISQYQKLSQKFIEEFADKLDWDSISICQKLSEKFIQKHIDRVNIKEIFLHQKLSEEFKKKYNK